MDERQTIGEHWFLLLWCEPLALRTFSAQQYFLTHHSRTCNKRRIYEAMKIVFWQVITRGVQSEGRSNITVLVHSFCSESCGRSRASHTVQSSAASFNFQRPLFSLWPSCGCLRFLPRLPVTYILPSFLPPITCFRRQFLRKMWPIHLSIHTYNVYRILLSSLTLCNTSSSVQLIFSLFLQHHISKLSKYFWSTFRSVQVSGPYKTISNKYHNFFEHRV